MLKDGIGGLMKQARQLQDKMAKLQEEMAAKMVEASAGGGMVSVTANGAGDVVSVKIDPQVVDPPTTWRCLRIWCAPRVTRRPEKART